MSDSTSGSALQGQLLRGSMEPMLLACLEEGPAHGYRIIELLRERSGEVFALAEGTIYPALRRLEKGGLVTSRWSEGPGGRRRRVYTLAARGKHALAEHRRAWRTFSGAVEQVLLRGETCPSTT